MTEQSITEVFDRATAIGAQHGRNAGSSVFDGNTSTETYAAVLKGIEDSDPRVMDAYNPPNLSGEYADDYGERDLAADLDVTHYAEPQASLEDIAAWDEAANAYNDAASAAFWDEIERVCRYHLA